jgi:hypothetical protein
LPKHYSPELVEMVDLCLRRDYKTRPNLTNILSKSSLIKKAETLTINIQAPFSRKGDIYI